ncbi:hypothetical protein NM688_g2218 [Phlebia brevispora]|uniref:Uncharacterized protein n=1 Tax=Phlebia brevispora TaxID=194682 RepID=A0ACC1T8W9_9APHY|nr:hypothetical protein NM688_g2218 [Phlebia brevispora]
MVVRCDFICDARGLPSLPFDGDPANPDGDNINLLYKYIVNMPLSFPDYISADARNLLSIMLVPSRSCWSPIPEHRPNRQAIMAHQWPALYAHLFDRTVDKLEETAMEQHRQKRLAYQKQMRQQAVVDSTSSKMARSQSAAVIPNGGRHSSRQRAQP